MGRKLCITQSAILFLIVYGDPNLALGNRFFVLLSFRTWIFGLPGGQCGASILWESIAYALALADTFCVWRCQGAMQRGKSHSCLVLLSMPRMVFSYDSPAKCGCGGKSYSATPAFTQLRHKHGTQPASTLPASSP